MIGHDIDVLFSHYRIHPQSVIILLRNEILPPVGRQNDNRPVVLSVASIYPCNATHVDLLADIFRCAQNDKRVRSIKKEQVIPSLFCSFCYL